LIMLRSSNLFLTVNLVISMLDWLY
jgi:hypothetical protein